MRCWTIKRRRWGRGRIKTASYAQVVEPIYNRSAGRWRNYRKHLEPIFPVLRPWVEKFGYSLDDPTWIRSGQAGMSALVAEADRAAAAGDLTRAIEPARASGRG